MFARQPEIRAYLEKCWENTACRKTLLNTEIGKLAWDERQSLWHLHDAQGNHYTANAVVSGMGGLSTRPIHASMAWRTSRARSSIPSSGTMTTTSRANAWR